MLKIGLTGGIGSGKSTVSRIFNILGIPVFKADLEAKILTDQDKIIREQLIYLFGPDIYTAESTINRKKLASLIFNDQNLLNKVNAIVHPLVKERFIEWIDKQQKPYVIHEAAILFESGFHKMMDFNILVIAPEPLRIKRVMERDKLSNDEIKARMERQWTDDRKKKYADFIITNDDKHLIIPQVIEIDKKLKSNGKIW